MSCIPRTLWYQLIMYGFRGSCFSLADKIVSFTKSKALLKSIVKIRTALQSLLSKILVCLVLDSEQSICSITCLSISKLGVAQNVLNDWLCLRMTHDLLKQPRNNGSNIDTTVVWVLYRHVHFGERINSCPLPRVRPCISRQRQIPNVSNNRCEYLSTVFPDPVLEVIWSCCRFLYSVRYLHLARDFNTKNRRCANNQCP